MPTPSRENCRSCQTVGERPSALVDALGDQGRLVWLCPSCGRAWPLAATGDRGAMARSTTHWINSGAHSSLAQAAPMRGPVPPGDPRR